MVLVDTSIWNRFLANRLDSAEVLVSLLNGYDVIGHPFVYGELLIGDNGGRGAFLAGYRRISHLDIVPNNEVERFVQARKLLGRGIGWIDAHLLAAAIVGGAKLWTADIRLHAISQEIGVAYAKP